MRFVIPLAFALLIPLPALADAHSVCVENGTAETWIFVADADDGERMVETLTPGAQLCSQGLEAGTVAAFVHADDLEGCSRRVPAGAVERLEAFPGTDLCEWARQ